MLRIRPPHRPSGLPLPSYCWPSRLRSVSLYSSHTPCSTFALTCRCLYATTIPMHMDSNPPSFPCVVLCKFIADCYLVFLVVVIFYCILVCVRSLRAGFTEFC
ncbi:hypothetical protein SCHPADRAFT_159788 [Schizopora paradoxa]|uniref:Uncharacterized protein n=1 Tax=Schizopora paradoxa TaxID=27342 RepID=A0A0H2S7D8_9AGAM|nr:hypothetical protein SCHPADRAFT_159788 [Schizopora paradoxa]